jgi:LacI family transcriptional regulator, galactose operon repressor
VTDPSPPDLRSRPRRRRVAHDDGTRVTLQDVADRAGVSLTTASRVVNEGARKVGPAMAERVARAVAELGYQANLSARAVASGYTSMMGITVRDIDDPYFSSIAAGLIEATDAQQFLVCISRTSGEREEREYVSLMRAQRARAVLLVGSRSDNTAAREALRAEVDAFVAAGGRVACVGQDLLGVDTIMPDNAGGAAALARALVALGHRSFAVLAGPRDLLTARDRVAGFRAELKAWSVELDPNWVIEGAFTRDGGYEAMSAVLATGNDRPDCVFAVNDVMAVGALARLRAEGISIPADIAVAGFDDIPTLRDVYPPLTTVRLPLKRMGEMAASLVLGETRLARPRIIPVSGEVILRESTRPRRGTGI